MLDITVLNNMEYADAENFVHNNGYINTIGSDEVAASKSDRVADTYYELYDNDGNMVDMINFYQYYNGENINNPDLNAEIVEQGWERVA